jgi:hypothetical protein
MKIVPVSIVNKQFVATDMTKAISGEMVDLN